jgi:hypothetical protein
LRRDTPGYLDRALQLSSARNNLLHEPHAMGGRGVEFVSRQQVEHRVALSRALDESQCGPMIGHDAALHLELSKSAVGRRDHDVGGQH